MKISAIGWNAAGLALPLLVALLCIPELLAALGSERFGLLSLGWALTAMAGLFDLGIGRAATQMAASILGRGEARDLPALARVAVRLAWGFGLLGGALFALLALVGAAGWIRVSEVPSSEISAAIWVLSLGVPFQALIAVNRGLSEARQRFTAISMARMTVGAANFAAPLLVSHYTINLAALMLAIVVTRVVGWLLYRSIANSHLQDHSALPAATDACKRRTRRIATELLRSGGWLTVSGVVSPILVQSDRFLIASLVSAASVATYTVPFELVTQLLIVTTAISTVSFPVLAAQLHSTPQEALHTFRKWLAGTASLMAIVCLLAAIALPFALPQWTNSQLPTESTRIGQVLCLGVWLNSVGVMCFAMLHARGRFQATAQLHLVELPGYLLLLWLSLQHFGVVGAAYAWTTRVAIDSAALLWMSFLPTESGRV